MGHQDNRIKVIVINEHTMGLQRPGRASIEILQASVLKGASFQYLPEPTQLNSNDTVRLANENDFNEFRIEFTQYASRPEEYLIQR